MYLSKLKSLATRMDVTSIALHPRLLSLPRSDIFRARVLASLCLVNIVTVPLLYLSLLSSFGGGFITQSIGFSLELAGGIATLLILRLSGRLRLAATVMSLSVLSGFVFFALTERVAISGTYFWFAGMGLFGLYLFGLKVGKYWCLLVIIIQTTLIQYFRHSPHLAPIGVSQSDFVTIFSGDVFGATLCMWTVAALYEFQRKRSELELSEAHGEILQQREQLMKIARLTELGQIAGGVAHEINNPLMIVQGYSNRLQAELSARHLLSERELGMFALIEKNCMRITNISRSLLSYAHEGAQEQSSAFSLRELQDEFMLLCRERMLNRSINLHIDATEADRRLKGRYGKLLQVIVNLLNNAIDAATESEEKWVRIELAISRDTTAESPMLEVRVSDSGSGIPEEIRERIKSPFFTTKAIGKGTGLGLSIVDGITRELKGSFYLDAAARSTTFVVHFPVQLVDPGVRQS